MFFWYSMSWNSVFSESVIQEEMSKSSLKLRNAGFKLQFVEGWYCIVGFNVPLDTLQVISETILQVR